MTGNEVVAYAALAAGAEIMYGYPITPQNEIMHYWTRLAPRFGRGFLQTEDEISAGFATLGGVLAGRRAFTGTSGPGHILMQEPMAMAEMMRLPMVAVIQQRGGPSTGTVIYSQQEVTMTVSGGNGEGLRIVYSTARHQELYDYTIKAFNTAWRYRFPTFVLGDGYQAKMREILTIYPPGERGIEMVAGEPYLVGPGEPGTDRPPVHLRNTYNVEEELNATVMELIRAYQAAAPEIAEYQESGTGDAEVVVCSHGVVSRVVEEAVRELRGRGWKVGWFRPVTLRPLAESGLKAVAARAGRLLVVESAHGQFARLLKEVLYGSPAVLETMFKPGQGFTVEEIVARVKEVARGGRS
jgi:2-oxoglutarate ferredoxin oxidoreductase subunit alpha